VFLHFAFCILHYGRDMGLQAYLILAAVVFGIGLFGVVSAGTQSASCSASS